MSLNWLLNVSLFVKSLSLKHNNNFFEDLLYLVLSLVCCYVNICCARFCQLKFYPHKDFHIMKAFYGLLTDLLYLSRMCVDLGCTVLHRCLDSGCWAGWEYHSQAGNQVDTKYVYRKFLSQEIYLSHVNTIPVTRIQ